MWNRPYWASVFSFVAASDGWDRFVLDFVLSTGDERSAIRVTKLSTEVRRSFFDQSCNLFRVGDVDTVTGACDFHLVAIGSGGIPPFEVGVDGSVAPGHQHPAWFASPRCRGDDAFEIVSEVEHLRARHEGGLLSRKIDCEELMKLRRVEVRETVSGFLYRAGFAQVTGKPLSVVGFILSSVWHVSRDVHQPGNGGIRSGFRNYSSAIAMRD